MNARTTLRERLEQGPPVLAPVCLDPLAARLIEQLGFGAGYLSGGALGFSLAVSEALLTVTEIATATRQITQRSALPLIVDIGVGFGDAVHVSRTIREAEAAGAAAVELEDQVAPKRAHHHRGVEHLVPLEEMVGKIEEAVRAREDDGMLLIARTGGVRNESLDAAIERGRAYAEAGADLVMLTPASEDDLRRAAAEIPRPLALMSIAGRWDMALLAEIGVPLLIDPFTGQVEMYRALRDAYTHIREQGAPATPSEELMAAYRELQGVAGMDELYAIEERTTERPA